MSECPRRDVEDRGREFAGDLVHVGNHQQQALAGRERRGQGAGLQGTVHGTGGAAFGLHFGHVGHDTPDIWMSLCGPGIRKFSHGRRGCNRVNGDDFVGAMGHRRGGLVAIDQKHGPRHIELLGGIKSVQQGRMTPRTAKLAG